MRRGIGDTGKKQCTMGVHMNRGMRFAFVAAALEGALSLAGSIGQSGHDGGIIRWLAARCPKVW